MYTNTTLEFSAKTDAGKVDVRTINDYTFVNVDVHCNQDEALLEQFETLVKQMPDAVRHYEDPPFSAVQIKMGDVSITMFGPYRGEVQDDAQLSLLEDLTN